MLGSTLVQSQATRPRSWAPSALSIASSYSRLARSSSISCFGSSDAAWPSGAAAVALGFACGRAEKAATWAARDSWTWACIRCMAASSPGMSSSSKVWRKADTMGARTSEATAATTSSLSFLVSAATNAWTAWACAWLPCLRAARTLASKSAASFLLPASTAAWAEAPTVRARSPVRPWATSAIFASRSFLASTWALLSLLSTASSTRDLTCAPTLSHSRASRAEKCWARSGLAPAS
mmetsp:Transcript_39293/g.87852  ORF Transcript_39293/g.87852 Transcript_39293/m.87852 type:complete len:237 (+) Transcript_39293:491-1201(+)